MKEHASVVVKVGSLFGVFVSFGQVVGGVCVLSLYLYPTTVWFSWVYACLECIVSYVWV